MRGFEVYKIKEGKEMTIKTLIRQKIKRIIFLSMENDDVKRKI